MKVSELLHSIWFILILIHVQISIGKRHKKGNLKKIRNGIQKGKGKGIF